MREVNLPDTSKMGYERFPAKLLPGLYKGLANVPEEKKQEILNYIGFDGGVPVWRNRSLENLPNEIWKDLKGDSKYQGSSWGRFKTKSVLRTDTMGRRTLTKERILVQYFNNYGYLVLCLHKHKRQWLHQSHVELGMIFHKNPENKPQINHIIGVKCFNMYSNLEWATASENQNHAVSNGLCTPSIGEKNGMSKLTNNEVSEIFNSPKSTNELAPKYNIGKGTIRRIRTGELWSDITGKKNVRKKFASDLVLNIFQYPFSFEETAIKFNVSYKQVYSIKRGISWGSLTGKQYTPNKNYFHAKQN